MVSSIVDENTEYHQNGMMPPFSHYQSTSMMMPSAWSNGGQSDQHIQYMQQMKKYLEILNRIKIFKIIF